MSRCDGSVGKTSPSLPRRAISDTEVERDALGDIYDGEGSMRRVTAGTWGSANDGEALSCRRMVGTLLWHSREGPGEPDSCSGDKTEACVGIRHVSGADAMLTW